MKPQCPVCHKVARKHYIKSRKGTSALGYWCVNCARVVDVVRRDNPIAIREEVRHFLTTHTGKFDVILADPPWSFRRSTTPKNMAEYHYATMKLEEISSLPVQ